MTAGGKLNTRVVMDLNVCQCRRLGNLSSRIRTQFRGHSEGMNNWTVFTRRWSEISSSGKGAKNAKKPTVDDK